MPQHPYSALIKLYFPQPEWDRAECIAALECDPSVPGYPVSCVSSEGEIDCGAGPQDSHAFGIFKLLDSCYNPIMNPASPFTLQQWSQVMDPNYNVWMASIIWSKYGWRAWTVCETCAACDIPGGPIPYPRGPVEGVKSGANWLLLLGAAAGIVGMVIVDKNKRGV
jgi:hypothetical protein